MGHSLKVGICRPLRMAFSLGSSYSIDDEIFSNFSFISLRLPENALKTLNEGTQMRICFGETATDNVLAA
jgi:hypothetical protein